MKIIASMESWGLDPFHDLLGLDQFHDVLIR